MNLLEDIARIKEVMGLNEQSFLKHLHDKSIEKEKEEFPHKDKKYNPDSDLDFSNSKVKDIVWRAGGMELFPHAGGLWFAENKEDVEKFAIPKVPWTKSVSHHAGFYALSLIVGYLGVTAPAASLFKRAL